MVRAIKVLPVPAGWEEDLRTDTVLAVARWEVVSLWSVLAETGVVDGALLESGGEGAEEWVACKHLEALWKGEKSLAILWVLWVGADRKSTRLNSSHWE